MRCVMSAARSAPASAAAASASGGHGGVRPLSRQLATSARRITRLRVMFPPPRPRGVGTGRRAHADPCPSDPRSGSRRRVAARRRSCRNQASDPPYRKAVAPVQPLGDRKVLLLLMGAPKRPRGDVCATPFEHDRSSVDPPFGGVIRFAPPVGKQGRKVAGRSEAWARSDVEPMRARASAASVPDPAVEPVIRAVGQLHDLVALIGAGGEVLWVSEALAALCGSHSFAGHWLTSLAIPEAEELRARLASARRITGERVTLRDRGGRAIAARVSAARVGLDSVREPSVAIFRLDDREDVGHEFRQRLDTLAAILDGLPDGVVFVDHSRFVRWANPAFAAMTGYPLAELVDRPLVVFLRSPDDLERIAATLQAGADAGRHEIEVRCRDGHSLFVEVALRPLTLRDGTELGAVAYLRDVTERRRIGDELTRRAEELQHWVNAVSHDLRSPLVAVLGFARLLREDYAEQLDEQGLRFLRRIEEAGRTMESLVHDLLEFARIGRSEPKRVHVDPAEVLHQLQAELKPRLEEARVTLGLPEESPLLWCDRTQLYQVLSNLVGNALDHMGPTVRPVIEVGVSEQDGFHHLVVRDHGRGIDPADHERIFEIFQTRGIPRSGRRGTGIGLAVVRKIAAAHGGAAWVESRPGEGAAFHVTFPAA